MSFVLFLLLLLHNKVSALTDDTVKYLPKVTLPVSYEIRLIPQIVEGNFTFHGQSKIDLRVLAETPSVTLHSKDLWIDENVTSLVDVYGIEHEVKKHTYAKATDFLEIEFQRPIAAGNYTLRLQYAGNMTSGIYNASYADEKGEKRWYIATSLNRRKARTAFPCWDEFPLKATFNLSIKHFPNFTAVSNMPVLRTSIDSDDKVWTEFGTTPPMPIYRFGFVVSDFGCIRGMKNKSFSMCGRKEFLPHLGYPLEVIERAIDFLEEYFDSKYNFPKLDHFTVPFHDGGYVCRRVSKFIKYVEPDFRNPNALYSIERGAVIVAEEVAGDWIDSLVTVKTVGSSWITEGLSMYLGYYIVDKLFSDWREMDVFIQSVQSPIISSSGIDEPIERYPGLSSYTIPSPKRATQSSVVFFMMSNILSEDTFKEGIRIFLKENQGGSVNADDLWSAMQSAYDKNNKESSGNLPIKKVMDPWIRQNGYPLITVKRDYKTGRVTITQESIRGLKSDRYWVPINFATRTNPNFEKTTPTHWLKPEDEYLVIDGIDKDDWIIVNIQRTGFYRVDYDETNWKRIAEYLNTEDYQKIHIRNRAQLIDDLYTMIILKRHDFTLFLDLVRYLAREVDYVPWFPAISAINKVRYYTHDWEIDENIKTFALGLMEKLTGNIDFAHVGKYNWMLVPLERYHKTLNENETFYTRRFGNTFVYAACSLGHPLCLETESAQKRAFFNDPYQQEIFRVPGLSYFPICDEAVIGPEDEMLKTMETNPESMQYVKYLACSSRDGALFNFVDRVLKGELKPSAFQMSEAIIYLIWKAKNTPRNNVDYIIENFDAICKYLEPKESTARSKSYIKRMLDFSIGYSYTSERLQKLINLVHGRSLGGNVDLQRTIERIMMARQWRDEISPKINKWLRDHSTHARVSIV